MSYTIDLLNEVLEFLEPYVDVVDGSYGEPHPNKAMSLTTAIEQEIELLKRREGRNITADRAMSQALNEGDGSYKP